MSDASKIAIHAVAYILANKNRLVSASEIADRFNFSEAHLYKVIQRLKKSNILNTVRGPKGGIKLSSPQENITLLKVFESIDGTMNSKECVLGTDICGSKHCVMGNITQIVNNIVLDYFKKTIINNLEIIDDLQKQP